MFVIATQGTISRSRQFPDPARRFFGKASAEPGKKTTLQPRLIEPWEALDPIKKRLDLLLLHIIECPAQGLTARERIAVEACRNDHTCEVLDRSVFTGAKLRRRLSFCLGTIRWKNARPA